MKLIIFSLAMVQAAKLLTQHQKTLLKQEDDTVTESVDSDFAANQEDDTVDTGSVDCVDSSNGATDSYGDGCDWYDNNPSGCGSYDSEDFTAATMCCGCQYSYEVSRNQQ